ncbi:hypothetical protein [Microlunatus speluncae]|uniref:hypothetical protein n=1 Tax=Microlunatus speluncae TaxID=2594267 RepID=UPI0012666DA0|nr:hypothetical protein [Microlunatus speluncae]
MSALSDRLAAAKGERSIDDIVARAGASGHRIDRSVVARYLNGEHGPRPRQETLSALAAGFDLDARELRGLAGRPPGELGPYVPTSESASLTSEQRQALDQLIKAITRGASGRDRRAEADGTALSERHGLLDSERRVANRRSVRPGNEEADEE